MPLIASEDYVPELLSLVEAHDVAAVLPLTDLDGAELVSARDELARLGATLFLPDAAVVDALFDKHACHLLLRERGIGSPDTWLPDEVPEDAETPLLVKQRWGWASRNIHRCETREQLDFFLDYVRVPAMVQRLCGGEEFSIDVLCDLEGRALNAIPRTMIESKGGESIKGMTIKDAELIDFARTVAEALPIWGPANVQCFREPDGTHQVTDVNPRFGGGFPLPLAAGGRYPELALQLANGEQPEVRVGDFLEGVVMTRFFSHLCLTADDAGTLEPFAEEVPEPIASEPGEA